MQDTTQGARLLIKTKGLLLAILNLAIPLMIWYRADYQEAVAWDIRVYQTKPLLFVAAYGVDVVGTLLCYAYLWKHRAKIQGFTVTLKMLAVFIALFAWAFLLLLLDLYLH